MQAQLLKLCSDVSSAYCHSESCLISLTNHLLGSRYYLEWQARLSMDLPQIASYTGRMLGLDLNDNNCI